MKKIIKTTFISFFLSGTLLFAELETPITVTEDKPLLTQETVITSDELEFETREDKHVFLFHKNVEIKSDDMQANCDRLEIFSNRESSSANKEMASMGSVELITADGQVIIRQNDRLAEAGHAEIFPKEGKIILTKSPSVTDPDGTVRGERMVLYKNQKKAIVEGEPGKRPTVLLTKMTDLSFDHSKKLTEEAKK